MNVVPDIGGSHVFVQCYQRPYQYRFVRTTMANEIKHLHVTYNDIHNLIRAATPQIVREFNPDFLIAIGGG